MRRVPHTQYIILCRIYKCGGAADTSRCIIYGVLIETKTKIVIQIVNPSDREYIVVICIVRGTLRVNGYRFFLHEDDYFKVQPGLYNIVSRRSSTLRDGYVIFRMIFFLDQMIFLRSSHEKYYPFYEKLKKKKIVMSKIRVSISRDG